MAQLMRESAPLNVRFVQSVSTTGFTGNAPIAVVISRRARHGRLQVAQSIHRHKTGSLKSMPNAQNLPDRTKSA